MVDYSIGSSKDRWVCPNDRQLALRAKLRTGWSVKTQQMQSFNRQDSTLNESEQEVIKEVIRRAEKLDLTEQERVGRLVERLENMKKNTMGNGTNQCILCGDHFGMLGSPSLLCHDCKKAVCQKCGIETVSAYKEPISLCKICSETREMWKKSGAWFFKGLPRYVLPEKKVPQDTLGRYGSRRVQRPGLEKNNWSKGGGGVPRGEAAEDESSSEDELTRRSRQASRMRPPDDSDGTASLSPSIRHSVTFDPNLGPMSTSPVASQHSETLSFASDPDQQYGDPERNPGREYQYQHSLDSVPSYSRQPSFTFSDSGSNGYQRQASQPDNWDAESAQAYQPQQQPYTHTRRDSQSSMLSRDCCWSEDRASLSGSSVSGHRTLSSGGDPDYGLPPENANLGTLELSLLYDPMASALHCSLHRAKALKPMDINGLSDPFCRINLLPTGGKSNRLRTKTVHKTRNPEFNETLTFYGVTESEVAVKMLHILVLDDDKYGHDFIGEARIPLVRMRPQQPRHMNIYLEKHYPVEEEDEVWGHDTWTRGQILVTLSYSTRRRALVVGVVRCVNLQPMDKNGFSDPFVKLRLKPDPYHRKYKTSIKWKNLNPVFNEEFVFETKMTELPKQALEITVWDKDYGKTNDYLGGLQLGWHSKGERLKHWVDVIKYPDHKHDGWHNLGEDLLSD